MGPRHVLALSFVVLLGVIARLGRADEEKKQDKDAEPYLKIRLIDEEGKPVAGAQAGIWVVVSNFDNTTEGDWNFRYGDTADANGIARFREGEDVFEGRPVVIVRHPKRRLAGIQSLAGKDRAGVIEITLRPECHVQWGFASNQVKASGKDLGRLNVIVTFEDMICSFSIVKGSTFHTLLPPGRFKLGCVGTNVKTVSTDIEIKAGQRSLDLGTRDLGRCHPSIAGPSGDFGDFSPGTTRCDRAGCKASDESSCGE